MIIALFIFRNAVIGIDNDFFHIAQSGKELLADASSMYENKHFVKDGYGNLIQQWLYSILLYKSFDIGGETGVILFTAVQYVLFLFVVYKYLVICKVGKQTAFITSLAIPFCMNGYISCRPQMISMILFVMQFAIIEKYRQTGDSKILCGIPLLVLLEVNLHLAFGMFHIIFLLPFIVPIPQITFLEYKADNLPCKPFLLPIILSLVAMLINPYTYQSYTLLVESKRISALGIKELQALAVLHEEFAVFFVGFLMFVFLTIRKEATSTSILLLLGTAELYAAAIRNVLFYTLAILYLLKEILLLLPDAVSFWEWFNNRLSVRLTGIIAGIGAAVFGLSINFCNISDKAQVTPDNAIQYIAEQEADLSEIRMFTPFNTGAYFVWNGIGHVYLEPKTEPYLKAVNQKKDIISEFCFIRDYADADDIKNFLDEYQFDYLYIDSTIINLGTYLSASDEYECVVKEGGELYADYQYPAFRLFKKKA